MQQFFVDDATNVKFSTEQRHQIQKVLRMQKKEPFRIVDINGNGYVYQFMDDSLSEMEQIRPIEFHDKQYRLKIIMSLIRNERLEWMIQKAAETGVDEIVLYQADHGVVRDYGKKTHRKLERFNKIALEASEQSYRQFPLIVSKVISKKELKNELGQINLVADVLKGPHLTDKIMPKSDIVIIVGPEGGFSEAERSHFNKLGCEPVSLGRSILRAETAPIVASSFVSLLDKELNNA